MDAAVLADLFRNTNAVLLSGDLQKSVLGISYDSRKVQPGFLFVAVPGVHTDGHDYIGQAIESGAAAVVVERSPGDPVLAEAERKQVPVLRVPDSRKALAETARRWFGEPERRLQIIGVTGTDGKSSTVWYCHQLLEALGYRAGFVSTVSMQTGAASEANNLRQSTPESPEIFKILKAMADQGKAHAILEATSHGLSEKTARLAGVRFQTGIFTNISHEHLEFHGSFDQYLFDKANLFRKLGQADPAIQAGVPLLPAAVINAGSGHAWHLAAAAGESQEPGGMPPRVYFYAIAGKIPPKNHELPLALWAENVYLEADSLSFDACFHTYSPPEAAASPARKALHSDTRSEAVQDSGKVPTSDSNRGQSECLRVRVGIPGEFTVENVLAAVLGVHAHTGRSFAEILAVVPSLRGVKGRMRPIREGQPFGVLVDYAHTPGSFSALLPVLRKSCAGRLILVFGSGGERDLEKRPIQGRIAGQYADRIILTNEDPRLEDPRSLLKQIAAGVEGSDAEVRIVPDRREAIRTAFVDAQEGDLVALLGKGHEQSIILKDGKIPWDEETVAREELAALGYRTQIGE